MTIYTPEEAVAYDAECLMNAFREKRNILLAETDWCVLSDVPTAAAELLTYRQSLRDLPATATPTLDADNKLTGVTWPPNPDE